MPRATGSIIETEWWHATRPMALAAAITLLYGLIAFGQIRMRKIDGHRTLADLIKRQVDQAA